MPAASGIAAERELMEPLRRWADLVINTTQFAANQLQQAMREQFAPAAGPDLTVTVSSFGFSRGCRPSPISSSTCVFLNNPHWDGAAPDDRQAPDCRIHPPDPAFDDAFARIRDLLLAVLPAFRRREKPMFTSLWLHRRAPSQCLHGRTDRRGLAQPRIFTHNAAPQPAIACGRPRRRGRQPMTVCMFTRTTGVNTMVGNSIRSAIPHDRYDPCHHGKLAEEFVHAMEHVVGRQEAIATVCIGPNDDVEKRAAKSPRRSSMVDAATAPSS
jgi:hypothetical protein